MKWKILVRANSTLPFSIRKYFSVFTDAYLSRYIMAGFPIYDDSSGLLPWYFISKSIDAYPSTYSVVLLPVTKLFSRVVSIYIETGLS